MEDNKRDKAIQAISKDPNRIIKTNPIINAKFDITSVQMKVFLKIIASIDQSKDEISEVQISVAELQKFVGRTSKNIYKYLQEELIKLKQRNIYYEDDNIRLDSNLLSSIIYHKKQGYFTFEIPKALKPFLLQIKENFTVLDIRNMLFLESIYAMRFYEYCKEFERFKTFEIGVEDLKERFGLTDRYKNYFDFKLKVINQARSELMKSSELYFNFEEIKEGKKIVRLRFTVIKNKQSDERLNIDLDDRKAALYDKIKLYVSVSTVNSWFEKYPTEQLEKGVEHTLAQLKNGHVKDVGAYLQKMVSTVDLFNSAEQVQNENKKKIEQEQVLKQQEQFSENQKNKIKTDYYEAKKRLTFEIFKQNQHLPKEIYNQLKNENEGENGSFLAEIAFKNYKRNEKFEPLSYEEFVYNIEEAGSFSSYVFEFMQSEFSSEYTQLKNEYIPKAQRVGVKENELI